MIDHLKEKGFAWLAALTVLTVAAYTTTAVFNGASERDLTANVTVAVFSSSAAFGSFISLLVAAFTPKDKWGDLSELKTPLVVGLLGGGFASTIKLLVLFGVVS